jgi:hypothetical protein
MHRECSQQHATIARLCGFFGASDRVSQCQNHRVITAYSSYTGPLVPGRLLCEKRNWASSAFTEIAQRWTTMELQGMSICYLPTNFECPSENAKQIVQHQIITDDTFVKRSYEQLLHSVTRFGTAPTWYPAFAIDGYESTRDHCHSSGFQRQLHIVTTLCHSSLQHRTTW